MEPFKSFFVSMLTRDIDLEGAILDLIDNCVDGILRGEIDDTEKPYIGRWANVEFDRDSFTITDNCGGIPRELAESAFRIGRDPNIERESKGSIGVYGIGMKRAIFKMGESCSVITKSQDDEYCVKISPGWMKDEQNWRIPIRNTDTGLNWDGTKISITHLHDGIRTTFDEIKDAFQAELIELIITHYSFIIAKGFTVTVNGVEVQPMFRGLIHDPNKDQTAKTIQPFLYKAKAEGDVEVFLAVGFSRAIPSQDEIDSETEAKRNSTEGAGWTIVCNDRAVLSCDLTVLTGWGETTVPRYHTQFIAVSGLVEFRCEDTERLPMTTTKRGVDASSPLYLHIKNKMREGMKIFTDYTNHWKGLESESRIQFASCESITFPQLKARTEEWQFNATQRSIPGSSQFKPTLPKPKKEDPKYRRITFSKEVDKVTKVADYLFGDSKVHASIVGEKCFDEINDEANG